MHIFFFFALLLIKLTVSPIRLLVRFHNRHFFVWNANSCTIKEDLEHISLKTPRLQSFASRVVTLNVVTRCVYVL